MSNDMQNSAKRLLGLIPEGIDTRLIPEIGNLMNLLILNYEIGAVTRNLVYAFSAQYNVGDDRSFRAHREDAKYELADVLLQSHLLCERMGWDPAELMALGEERFRDRMQDIKDKAI